MSLSPSGNENRGDSCDFKDLLGKLGTLQLDVLMALRDAFGARNIGPDFFRWVGTPDCKVAFDVAMTGVTHAYRVSLAGASELFTFLTEPGIFDVPEVPEVFSFEVAMLTDRGCSVVEMTQRFRDCFPPHSVPVRPKLRVSPYVLTCASLPSNVILACGMRPYADWYMLREMLGAANSRSIGAWSPLLTTRSNLFCMLDAYQVPCIVELWNDSGWHLDAHGSKDRGDFSDLFEPGYRMFAPVGTRHKANEPVGDPA